jgi:hypothetical protein
VNILNEAQHWLRLGISPIPIQPKTKYLIKGTRIKHYIDALPTPMELIENFYQTDYNLAIIPRCGKNDLHLTILDFDNIAQFFQWYDGIETRIVKTKRGRHVYFWCKESPVGFYSDMAEIKYHQPVLTCPSEVKEHQYSLWKEAPIIEIDRIEDVIEGARKKRGVVCTPKAIGAMANFSSLRVPDDKQLYRGIIQDIKNRLPILTLASRYTQMSPSSSDGRWYIGLCPAHDDSHPSFRVDAIAGRTNCFKPSCKLHDARGMDVLELHSRLHGLNYRESCLILASELELI